MIKRINFIGPLLYSNGLSISARGYVNSLINLSNDLNLFNLNFGFHHLKKNENLIIDNKTLIYKSFEKINFRKFGSDTVNIFHINLDLIYALQNSRAFFLSNNSYNILIPYWELANFDNKWFESLQSFNEIWCPSSFVKKCIDTVTSIKTSIIRPSIIDNIKKTKIFDTNFFPNDKSFKFLYVFDANSIIARKNPSLLADAFIRLFKNNPKYKCIFKISNPNFSNKEFQIFISKCVDTNNIIFIYDHLSESDLLRLYNSIDCFVSPHKSEGLGLTMIESAYLKKPVIATPYGGAMDFISKNSGYPIDYDLRLVGKDNHPYHEDCIWAEPSLSSLMDAMTIVYKKRNINDSSTQNLHNNVKKLFSKKYNLNLMKRSFGQIK